MTRTLQNWPRPTRAPHSFCRNAKICEGRRLRGNTGVENAEAAEVPGSPDWSDAHQPFCLYFYAGALRLNVLVAPTCSWSFLIVPDAQVRVQRGIHGLWFSQHGSCWPERPAVAYSPEPRDCRKA
jgi:hypothetical protein